MTTPFRRAIVSLAATTTITFALGACVSSRPLQDGTSPMNARATAVRFENDGTEHVHVYLIGEARQWLLGRVEPGAIATLRIPDESLAGESGFVRLAVLAGQPVTLQAGRHPRAALTIARPASEILSQRWWFSQGRLTSLGRH